MTNNEIHRFLAAALEVYIQTSRRTGRTSSMLLRAKPGDVAIAANCKDASHLDGVLRSLGIRGVEVMPCPVNCSNLFDQTHRRSFGAIHIDHTWVEEFYKKELIIARRGLQTIVEPDGKTKPDPWPPHWSEPLTSFQLTLRNAKDTDAP